MGFKRRKGQNKQSKRTRKRRKSKYDKLAKFNKTQWRKQQELVRYLRSEVQVEVEGRFQAYVSVNAQDKSARFGYTKGLPDVEILNSSGKYNKCAIYLSNVSKKNPKNHKQLAISKIYGNKSTFHTKHIQYKVCCSKLSQTKFKKSKSTYNPIKYI